MPAGSVKAAIGFEARVEQGDYNSSAIQNLQLTRSAARPSLGGGYEADIGDMAFWRAEGSMQMWDDASASGSEAGGTGGSNKIEAELGSITGTLSVGMKF